MALERTEMRPLEILGIGEAEERAYRWLLANSDATAQELVKALAVTRGKAQRLLDTIEAKGLVTHSPEYPRRYIAAAPDIALKALILRRQESLERAEIAMEELQEYASVSRPDDARKRMLELITSPEAERQVFEQMHHTAEREVIALTRSPVRISRLDIQTERDQVGQRKAQTRGVNYRGIVDSEFLTLPGAIGAVRSDIKSGQKVRVATHLPFKMIVADRRIAIIPLSLERPNGPVLLVRSSALLDALCVLFEVLWERASPLPFTSAGIPEIGESKSRFPEGAEDLLSLMATGLNDKKIADEMGLSLRTLYRHIAELMKSMDARTRFQFGWLASLRMSDRVDPEGTSGRTP